MSTPDLFSLRWVLITPTVMLFIFFIATFSKAREESYETLLWNIFTAMSLVSLISTFISLFLQLLDRRPINQGLIEHISPIIAVNLTGSWVAILVQMLGLVIARFSARYLQGESRQSSYIACLACVQGAVHVLLLANHWLVLICAWALASEAIRRLLCFFPERPFAQLAAHKKNIADRLADILLASAAFAAYWDTGSGSISGLLQHIAARGASFQSTFCIVCLVLAVMLRTALLPAHGWLIQVMEAPTPVSALLHAGVVNLGGFVLVRFSPLLEAVPAARWLLIAFGLGNSLLAGFVMLTRISIKVRLAWSTIAQMGFMVLECGLGLYQLAILHLIGHSLYKAHTFLSASAIVRQTRLRMMHDSSDVIPLSMMTAPFLAFLTIILVQKTGFIDLPPWIWWWNAVLALAWAPLFWLQANVDKAAPSMWYRLMCSIVIVAVLTRATLLEHTIPLGIGNAPNLGGEIVAFIGMTMMYAALSGLQVSKNVWLRLRRWSYAGFYVDEIYTRCTLKLWPMRWPASGPITSNVTELASAVRQ